VGYADVFEVKKQHQETRAKNLDHHGLQNSASEGEGIKQEE